MPKNQKRAIDCKNKKGRRRYKCIEDEERLRLIQLIQNENMSCHKASKVLGIAYNNAKVIYRIYKKEGRIKQTPKFLKRHAKALKGQGNLMDIDPNRRELILDQWNEFQEENGRIDAMRAASQPAGDQQIPNESKDANSEYRLDKPAQVSSGDFLMVPRRRRLSSTGEGVSERSHQKSGAREPASTSQKSLFDKKIIIDQKTIGVQEYCGANKSAQPLSQAGNEQLKIERPVATYPPHMVNMMRQGHVQTVIRHRMHHLQLQPMLQTDPFMIGLSDTVTMFSNLGKPSQESVQGSNISLKTLNLPPGWPQVFGVTPVAHTGCF